MRALRGQVDRLNLQQPAAGMKLPTGSPDQVANSMPGKARQRFRFVSRFGGPENATAQEWQLRPFHQRCR